MGFLDVLNDKCYLLKKGPRLYQVMTSNVGRGRRRGGKRGREGGREGVAVTGRRNCVWFVIRRGMRCMIERQK